MPQKFQFASLVAIVYIALSSNVAAQSVESPLVQQGYSQLSQGALPMAVATLSQAVQQNPQDAEARRYLGHAMLMSGQAHLAIQQFETLSRLGPSQGADLAALGDGYASLGITDKATEAYTRALQQDPRLVRARLGLARAHLDAKNTQAARQLCQQGLQQATNASERAQIGGLLTRINAVEDAAQSLSNRRNADL